MKHETKQQKQSRIKRKMQKITGENYSRQDPSGSYTGKPGDIKEIPVQDADDL